MPEDSRASSPDITLDAGEPAGGEWISSAESIERSKRALIPREIKHFRAVATARSGPLTAQQESELAARCQSRAESFAADCAKVDGMIEWQAARVGLTMKVSARRDELPRDPYAFFDADGLLVAKTASFSDAYHFLRSARERAGIDGCVPARSRLKRAAPKAPRL